MTARKLPPMTDADLEGLVRKAVRAELNDAGLRLDDTDHQYEARKDFTFLRRLRQSSDGAATKVGYAILLAVVGGLVWLVTSGLSFWKSQ